MFDFGKSQFTFANLAIVFPFQRLAVLRLHRLVLVAALRSIFLARHVASDERPAAHHAVERIWISAPVRLPVMFHGVAPRLAGGLQALEVGGGQQVEIRLRGSAEGAGAGGHLLANSEIENTAAGLPGMNTRSVRSPRA